MTERLCLSPWRCLKSTPGGKGVEFDAPMFSVDNTIFPGVNSIHNCKWPGCTVLVVPFWIETCLLYGLSQVISFPLSPLVIMAGF